MIPMPPPPPGGIPPPPPPPRPTRIITPRKGWKFFSITIVGGLILIIVCLLAWYGFMPVISSLLKTNSPKDLGVSSSIVDKESLYQKLGQSKELAIATKSDSCFLYSGSRSLSISITEAELTATVQRIDGKKINLNNLKYKILADGTIKMSGYAEFDYHSRRINNAFYAEGKVNIVSNKAIRLQLKALEIGRWGIEPTEQIAYELAGEINAKLQRIGVNFETVGYSAGAINFTGSVPEKIELGPC